MCYSLEKFYSPKTCWGYLYLHFRLQDCSTPWTLDRASILQWSPWCALLAKMLLVRISQLNTLKLASLAYSFLPPPQHLSSFPFCSLPNWHGLDNAVAPIINWAPCRLKSKHNIAEHPPKWPSVPCLRSMKVARKLLWNSDMPVYHGLAERTLQHDPLKFSIEWRISIGIKREKHCSAFILPLWSRFAQAFLPNDSCHKALLSALVLIILCLLLPGSWVDRECSSIPSAINIERKSPWVKQLPFGKGIPSTTSQLRF